ncbi:hypothetical protein B0H16DRAFT_1746503 [Mycena metata]|uniref:Ribonuclease H1 N-terminal domain-containing protein n=1 Tax=Mycena metata TaxID=1033252 RepID=A0AAD7MA06_9AGAR|nr:hypothetical protein B0H16DRAFT_1746503 [Mycena metata]
MADPPPPYDPVDQTLLANLARLSVSHSTATDTGSSRVQFSRSPPSIRRPPTSGAPGLSTPSTPSRASGGDGRLYARSPPSLHPPPTSGAPSTPPRPSGGDGRLYVYQSPTRAGETTSWAEAAAATQGVAGGRAHLAVKPSKARHRKKRAYAVFFGRIPGVYDSWPAEAQVKGARPAVHQGYVSHEAAHAAFQFAVEHGWTRVCDSSPTPLRFTVEAAPLGALPIPTATTNPLHGESDGLWYAVFCGVTPGIYGSALELSLNTVGLSCATYSSFSSRDAAIRKFEAAQRDGLVKIVTPLY